MLVQISTVVIENIYMFLSYLHCPIDIGSKCTLLVDEYLEQFVVLIVVVLSIIDIFAKLQPPSSFS